MFILLRYFGLGYVCAKEMRWLKSMEKETIFQSVWDPNELFSGHIKNNFYTKIKEIAHTNMFWNRFIYNTDDFALFPHFFRSPNFDKGNNRKKIILLLFLCVVFLCCQNFNCLFVDAQGRQQWLNRNAKLAKVNLQ